MLTSNDDNKYKVKSTDAYGIKTTKGGQKYLICHFIENDFTGKYAYDEVVKDDNLCTSVLLEKDAGQSNYFFEPFGNRVIGYVIGNFNKIGGWSCKNAKTDTYGALNLNQEDSIEKFINDLNTTLSQYERPKKIVVPEGFWNYIAGKEISEIENLLNDNNKNNNERFLNFYYELKPYIEQYKIGTVDDLKEFVDECNNKTFGPSNNQLNISGQRISSIIINLQADKFGQMNRKLSLERVVKNIDSIIEIQYNKLGHKSILVRDAGSKKIQKMKLHKFVDYIRDECKKVGINEAEIKKINPDFPTSKKVHKKTQGFWCKIKSFFGFNHHDHNNAYASYDTDVIKNGIDTLVHSNM